MVFSTNATIKDYLAASGKKQSSTTNDQQTKGVVYQLKCSCEQTYIGETKRPLNICIKEHRTSVKKGDDKSALSDHIKINPNHEIDWESVTKLACHKTSTNERKIIEAINIRRHKPKMNRDQGLTLSKSYDYLIEKL